MTRGYGKKSKNYAFAVDAKKRNTRQIDRSTLQEKMLSKKNESKRETPGNNSILKNCMKLSAKIDIKIQRKATKRA